MALESNALSFLTRIQGRFAIISWILCVERHVAELELFVRSRVRGFHFQEQRWRSMWTLGKICFTVYTCLFLCFLHLSLQKSPWYKFGVLVSGLVYHKREMNIFDLLDEISATFYNILALDGGEIRYRVLSMRVPVGCSRIGTGCDSVLKTNFDRSTFFSSGKSRSVRFRYPVYAVIDYKTSAITLWKFQLRRKCFKSHRLSHKKYIAVSKILFVHEDLNRTLRS